MSLPADFETCPSGTHKALDMNAMRIAELERDRKLLMEMFGVSEDEFAVIVEINERVAA